VTQNDKKEVNKHAGLRAAEVGIGTREMMVNDGIWIISTGNQLCDMLAQT
jgi:hypothetical protein